MGRLVGPADAGALSALSDYLQANLPWVAPTARDVGRGEITVLASLALLLSGVGWVESLRTALRAVWLVDQRSHVQGLPVLGPGAGIAPVAQAAGDAVCKINDRALVQHRFQPR